MSSVLSLPTETLSHILSYLRPCDLERLARTFNNKLTPLCVPLLCARNAALRNAQRMVAHFGEPALNHYVFKEAYTAAGLETTHGPFTIPNIPAARAFTVFDYLDFDGSARWLHPNGDGADTVASHCMYPREQIAALEAKAVELGAPLPVALVRYLTEGALQERIPEVPEMFEWSQVGPIVHVSGQVEGRVAFDGYVLRVHADDNTSFTATSLYFDAAGGDCVIECELFLDDPDDEEMSPGKPPQEARIDERDAGIQLEATSFEQFLAKSFFENTVSEFICTRHDEPEAEVPAMLREFLVKTFSKGDSA